MQHIKEFFDLDLSEIRSFLGDCKLPFDRSQLYSTAAEAKFVDESIRKSKYRLITDKVLFDLCDGVIQTLTASSSHTDYVLVRNDCTHIVYDAGGFFNAHSDYLSVTSNLIEEYTLILCVSPPATTAATVVPPKGGLTVIQPNPKTKFESRATTTPNAALLFRKDLTHSSTPLESGDKSILTLNVWAIRKRSTEFVCITFPAAAASGSGSAPSQASGACAVAEVEASVAGLKHAAARTYVLTASDIEQFPGSVLHTFLVEARKTSGGGSGSSGTAAAERFYTYEMRDCTFEKFEILYLIYTRRSVSTEKLAAEPAASALIERMGVATKLMLLDGLNPPPPPPAAKPKAATTKRYKPKGGKAVATPPPKPAPGREVKPNFVTGSDHRSDFIICNSMTQLRGLNHRCKLLRLPYMPFRILYAEGTVTYGGEMSGAASSIIKMLPIWFSVGDCDNIIGLRSLCHTSGYDKAPNLNTARFEKYILTSGPKQAFSPRSLRADQTVSFVRDDDVPAAKRLPAVDEAGVLAAGQPKSVPLPLYYSEDCTDEGHTVSFNGTVALPETSNAAIIKLLTANNYSDFWPAAAVAYPDGRSYRDPIGAPKTATAAAAAAATVATPDSKLPPAPVPTSVPSTPHHTVAPGSSLFHISASGRIAFSQSEMEETSAIFDEINFPRRVQQFIQNQAINFTLPQNGTEMSAHFCNESVYGNFTLLEAVGLIRLYGERDIARYISPFIPVIELSDIIAGYMFGAEPETAIVDGGVAARRGLSRNAKNKQ